MTARKPPALTLAKIKQLHIPPLTELQIGLLRDLPALPSHRLEEARFLSDYDTAVIYYLRQKVADTGKLPEEWSDAQRVAFEALLELWRRIQPATAEASIRELAAKYGVATPVTAEGFALLAVRLAARLGEPGFEQEPKGKSRGKPLLHAWVCTLMAEAMADGTTERKAAPLVQARLKAAGQDMALGSIVRTYHDQKRKIAAHNAKPRCYGAKTLAKETIPTELEPEDALIMAVALAPPLTVMERAALARVSSKWKALAPLTAPDEWKLQAGNGRLMLPRYVATD